MCGSRRLLIAFLLLLFLFFQLEHIIEESKKLDQQKYGNIAFVSNYTREKGVNKMKHNNEIAEKMFAVLSTKETTTTSPKPVPSLASYLMPHAITLLPYLFIVASCW